MIQKILFIILIASFAQAQKKDHRVGNGGAGVCISDKCVTLPEAGVVLPEPEEQYVMLQQETIKAIHKIAYSLPLGAEGQDALFRETVGQGDTFIRLDIVDPEKLKALKSEYIEILKAAQYSVNENNLEIYAFGNTYDMPQPVTYLLPIFFKLTAEQQAKVLIHEKNVRNLIKGKITFEEILELDNLNEKLLLNPDALLNASFRIDRWTDLSYKSIEGKSYDVRSQMVKIYLGWLLKNQNLILENSKACGTEYGFSTDCYFDRTMAMLNYNLPPAFIRLADKMSFKSMLLFQDKIELEEQDQAEILKICSEKLASKENVLRLIYPYREKSFSVNYYLFTATCSRGANGKYSVQTMEIK